MKKNKFIFKEVTSHELYGVLQDFVGGFLAASAIMALL
jgi:hypothetical protein